MIFTDKHLSTKRESQVNKSRNTHTLLQFLLNPLTVLYTQCYLCGASSHGKHLCSNCIGDLTRSRSNTCARCGLSVLPKTTTDGPSEECASCCQTPPTFDLCITPTDYKFPSDALVARLKFEKKQFLASTFAELIAHERLRLNTPLPDLICAVPSAESSKRARGFNQAELIAAACAKKLKLPFDGMLLTKAKETNRQALLTRQQRLKNMQGAFSLSKNNQALPSRVAVVDDVITTSATMTEAARVLKKHGVKQVEIWAFARTI